MSNAVVAGPGQDSDVELPADHGWDNRRMILASLAPRPTARPARHSRPTPADTADVLDAGHSSRKGPGVLRRSGRAVGSGVAGLIRRIPANRRGPALLLALVAVVGLVAAMAGVKALTAEIHPTTQNGAPVAAPPPPPPVSQVPLIRDAILTGVTAIDKCPRDTNYAEANRAFDGDLNTAWRCTRAGNTNGQLLQVNFGRQVTISQIRIDGGFDAVTPDGVDQWYKNQIVTQLEVYFPKELNRAPVKVDTGGVRDYRAATIDPPAVVSKLLLRVAETYDPPPSPTPDQTTPPPPDGEEVTTVAISDIQFIGHD
jgi:hypothetical protein